jgi:3-dehydroquinate synthase
MSSAATIPVSAGGDYNVTVGRDLLLGTDVLTDALAGVKKVLIVHQPSLELVAGELRDALAGEFTVLLAEIPDAEAAKRVEVAAFCWQVLGQSDFTRSDAIIGLGGGAVTDLAGFVAATWLRGVRFISIPTTVLGMVDASVGGKTGINTAEGKNLVGAFYAPSAVICDVALVESLPRNELLAGMAEVVKYGFIAEPEILDLIEADVAVATDPTSEVFRLLVEKSVGIKARVVSEDFR